jgi:hypothetical protein
VIELEMLEAMFDNIAAGPKWDMKGPMLWGYFFTDASAQKLEIVAEVLLETGYRLVELFEAEERVEIHSPQSLHERNAQLYELAERHGLRSYDGMDVGPAAPNE